MGIAYTNLGVRAPLNKITELVYEVLASGCMKDGFGAFGKVVIDSRSKARAVRKKPAKLLPDAG